MSEGVDKRKDVKMKPARSLLETRAPKSDKKTAARGFVT